MTANDQAGNKRKLSPDTIVQRPAKLKITLSENVVNVEWDDTKYSFGLHVLEILEVFSQRISLREGMEQLGKYSKGAQDWILMTQAVQRLTRIGILQPYESEQPILEGKGGAYTAAMIHIQMLNDRLRTSIYIDSLRELVQPEDVVLDIGTGTGVLATAAARAGAKRVYAIERTNIADVAQRLFEENGVADRVTLIRGDARTVELPERADLLVSEMIGKDPFDEAMLSIYSDARKRHLKPDARIIPRRARVYALLLTVPDSEVSQHVVMPDTLEKWRNEYGIRFDALKSAQKVWPLRFFERPQEMRKWTRLSDPILLGEIDMATEPRIGVKLNVNGNATQDGLLNAVMIYPDFDMTPNIVLPRHPDVVETTNHWYCPVYIQEDWIQVKSDEELSILYQKRGVTVNRIESSEA